jgi:hypothetical protein
MKQPPTDGAAETEEAEFRVPITTINAMNNSGIFTDETLQQILELKAGERTGVITVTGETATGTGAYYIFEAAQINIPTDEELEVSYREEYTILKKNEIFRGILDKWIEEASYTFNQQAVDTLSQ